MTDDAAAFDQPFELWMKGQPRLAGCILYDADALQGNRIAKPGAHRLGKSFLGRETIGEKQNRPDGPAIRRPLDGGQHAPCEALTVFLHEPRHAPRIDHVDADAVNHRALPMRFFISRTAWAIPVKTARATMAWPILSSATPGSRATPCTFS